MLAICLSFIFLIPSGFTKAEESKRYKDDYKSLIKWPQIEPEEWLDLENWIRKQETKSKTPLWKQVARDRSNKEIMARMIKCVGECRIYRGKNYAKGQYLSQVKEGDVVENQVDSFAWLYLTNGSLLRVSAESSVTFSEFIMTPETFFISLRLNEGQIYHYPRNAQDSDSYSSDGPETDQVFLPLMVAEANIEYYKRKVFKNLSEQERLLTTIDEKAARKSQVQQISERIKENNQDIEKKKSLFFVVAPNATFTLESEFNLLSLIGGKTYTKVISKEDEQNKVFYRGYTNQKSDSIPSDKWLMINKQGSKTTPINLKISHLELSQLIVKRIPTMILAQEIWFKKYSKELFKKNINEKLVAQEYGLDILSDDYVKKRKQFLIEYNRRLETTQLISVRKLIAENKLVARKTLLDSRFYTKALESYFLKLSQGKTLSEELIKDYTDKEYYYWMIDHAKK